MALPRLVRGAVVAALVAVVSLTVVAPSAAEEPGPARQNDPAARAALIDALARDLDLTPAQAVRLLDQQADAAADEAALVATLGPDHGGSWFDPATGDLVVAVTRTDRLRQVALDDDVRVVVVKRSKSSLDAVKAELDALAERDRAALTGVTAWSVDVKTNQVLVTVRPGVKAAATALVARYGAAVRVEESTIAPQTTADYLDGGDRYDVGCSVGFNVTVGGVGHFLTAGHCGTTGTPVSKDGVGIGPIVGSFFPGDDDALVRNDNPGYWIQGPWIFAYNGDPNGRYIVNGYRDSPVGTTVCKSGATTGLTCGTITAKNETVNYAQGAVFQLTRHSACVEQGDSGGSNFSPDAFGNFAEGMTSGASLQSDGSRLRCLQVFGGQNVSWYQPIAESLGWYGATLTTA